MRVGSFNWQRVAVTIAVTAALGVGLAAAFLHHASTAPDVVPTAGALEDAFSVVFGACLGLLIGSAAAALVIRRGSSLLAGAVVGFVAYWLAVVPYLASIASSDVSTSEDVDFTLLVFVPAAVSSVAGAAIGTVIRRAVAAYTQNRDSG